MERNASSSYIWISRIASFAGIVCIAIALVTAVTDTQLIADPVNYVQVAIAAFLFAIWSALAARF